MSDPWPQMRVSPGARADARLPAALDPIALRVRPATLAEDFAAAGRRLGAEVPPLARLFLDEPAYLLAEILAFRPEDAEQAFDIALDRAPDTAPALIRALALRLGDWVARIKARLPELSDARPARVMQAVLTGAPGADRAAATPADPPAPCHRPAAQHARTPAQCRGQSATRRRPHLRGAARLGRIDPALGLLLAELTAARDIDAAINTFAARHMRFYYGQIIGQHPRPASRESVLLHLPPSARPTHIAQGTPLRARTADGTVQRFVTETPVSVSPARVASTAVLVYDTDPKISFNAALAGITDIRAARYPPGPRPAPRPRYARPRGGAGPAFRSRIAGRLRAGRQRGPA